jgi:hypothetical protein
LRNTNHGKESIITIWSAALDGDPDWPNVVQASAAQAHVAEEHSHLAGQLVSLGSERLIFDSGEIYISLTAGDRGPHTHLETRRWQVQAAPHLHG